MRSGDIHSQPCSPAHGGRVQEYVVIRFVPGKGHVQMLYYFPPIPVSHMYGMESIQHMQCGTYILLKAFSASASLNCASVASCVLMCMHRLLDPDADTVSKLKMET